MDSPSFITDQYYVDTGNDIREKLSRYSTLKRFTNMRGDKYIETPSKIEIKETSGDSFYRVDKGMENRLDIISNMFYGTPLLWWAIAIMNNITNPFDVQAGIVLRIPTMNSIYQTGIIKP